MVEEEEVVDRLTGLETENEAMRSLLLSISQLLTELKKILELEDPLMVASHVDAALHGLPVEWVLDEVKEDIERSLALLSDRVAHICGIPL